MRRMELDAGIKNIMVIVPHEDDEILLAAGIMEKALAKGIGVHVVMAGNGDYEGHDEATGSVRLPETLAGDRKSTRLNSSHTDSSRMPSSA